MKNKGLATRLIVFILSGVTLVYVAAFAYNFLVSQQSILASVRESARDLTLETVYRLEVILRGVEKIPLNLAANLEHLPSTRQNLVQLVQNAVEHNQEIFGVSISFEPRAFDAKSLYFAPYCCREGDRLKTMWLGGEAYQYFYLDWYQIPKELGRSLWSEPYFDEGAGNVIMTTFAAPFYQDAGGNRKLQGVVTADVSLIWLKDIVAAVKFYQHGYAFLLSQNGRFVTHPHEAAIMRESIFSVAEARRDERLRKIGQAMVQGREGFVPVDDFFSGKKSWLYYASVPSSGWSLGVIFPEAELFASAYHLSQRTGAIVLLGLAFLSLLIIAMARTITRPLRRLALQTEAVAHGDFSARVPETGAREIAHLARSFNRMGDHLVEYIEKRDFIRDTFGRYVTHEVVKKLLESRDALELGGETREVSILMSDLRGFTALTAEMDPEEVITFLNRYLEKMIEILIDYRATIDEIIGDGILAFFGAPEPLEDHPARAVACALQMQAAMEDINALNEAEGLPHLEMGVALNTGAVVVGNIGSEKRAKYSVVGAHVNLTSRIEAFAVGGQVLISPATYERVRDYVEVGRTIQGQMKGFPGQATIYEVRGIHGPFNLRLKERSDKLIPLVRRLPAQVFCIIDKIVTPAPGEAWITQLGETAAHLCFTGNLDQWQDVRLVLLDENGAAHPGKLYGKVTSIVPGPDGLSEVSLHFTSVSPDIYRFIRELLGQKPV